MLKIPHYMIKCKNVMFFLSDLTKLDKLSAFNKTSLNISQLYYSIKFTNSASQLHATNAKLQYW